MKSFGEAPISPVRLLSRDTVMGSCAPQYSQFVAPVTLPFLQDGQSISDVVDVRTGLCRLRALETTKYQVFTNLRLECKISHAIEVSYCTSMPSYSYISSVQCSRVISPMMLVGGMS